MSELLSYQNILQDIKNFKNSGTNHGSDINIYDMPSHKYFKLLFYFGSNSEFGNDDGSGLLAPTWEVFNERKKFVLDAEKTLADENRTIEEEDAALSNIAWSTQNELHYYDFNSAWSYLMLNDEKDRAEKLEQFVTLLSDINSNSPWYFSKVGGLSEALERKVTEDGKLEISDKRLTITCLPDAFDNRITTLLDLYRDITWSWIHKREMVPANLRKFDMAIYIFETPNFTWHGNTVLDPEPSVIGRTPFNYKPSKFTNTETQSFNPSYKMIEFHGCEFNYNSIKSGWSEIDNQTGAQPTYTIDITFSDCYEISYNDIMMRTIGDVILTDLINTSANENDYISKPQSWYDDFTQAMQLDNRRKPIYPKAKTLAEDTYVRFGNLNYRSTPQEAIDEEYITEYKPGFITNAIGQVAGHLVADVKSLLNKAILGNIYTFSLTQMGDQLSDAMKGNLIKTGMSVAQYVKEHKARQDAKNKKPADGNIYDGTIIEESHPATGNIYSQKPKITQPKKIGNLFDSKTIANNL